MRETTADSTAPKPLKRYRCMACGHIHEGEMPDSFECPVCGCSREMFEPAD